MWTGEGLTPSKDLNDLKKSVEDKFIDRMHERDINRAKLSDEEFIKRLNEFLNQWTWC